MLNKYSFRLITVVMVIAILIGVLLYRLIILHVFDQSFLQRQGDARIVRSVPIVAYRGMITDRNGEVLAVSSPMLTLWGNGKILEEFIKKQPNKIQELADILGTNADELVNKITKNSAKDFFYIARTLTTEHGERALALKIPGISSLQEYKRFYPSAEVSSHVVGFTDIEDKGQEGIELAYDKHLSGIHGEREVWKDRLGGVIKDVRVVRESVDGKNLSLSIDLRVQHLSYRVLKKVVETHRSKSASAVVIDIQTGELLAVSNYPSYNPNLSIQRTGPFVRNRAILDLFEPGSTIKPFSMIAALSSGRWNPDSTVNVYPGEIKIGSYTIKDVSHSTVLNLSGILMKSSNVGVSKIALDIGGKALRQVFHSIGFGEDTGLSFPGERPGTLPDFAKWKPVETAALSYGYGLSVSLVSLASAYATLANSGIKVKPSIVSIQDYSTGIQVVDKDSAIQVASMLEHVIEDNSNSRAKVDGFIVGGKSGTARKNDGGEYKENAYRSLFVGFAPSKNPAIAVAIMVDEPQDGYYGGVIAAPIFSEVVAGVMRILQVTPQGMIQNNSFAGR